MTTPKFCSQCGNPLTPGARFCPQCGAPVQVVPVSPGPSPDAGTSWQTPAPAAVEPIVDVIPLQRRSGFMGMSIETFNMIVTPRRLILLPISKQEMQEAIKTAREQARAAGKGFFGQWAAQLAWLQVLYDRYRATPVETLAQTPGSIVFYNQEVHSVRLRDRSIGREEEEKTWSEIVIETTRGRFQFQLLTMRAREARQILQQTLGGTVR